VLRRLAVVFVALLLPLEAHTSGSSTVRATGPHLAVSLTSVRKIFHRGEGEYQWHAKWRAEHQPQVDAALVRLEPVLVQFAEAEALVLAEWSEALPLARASAPPDDELSPAQVCATSSCRAQLELWRAAIDPALGRVPPFEVEIALAAAPPEGVLTRLNEALARAAVGPAPK
jgi:hypothetical protein